MKKFDAGDFAQCQEAVEAIRSEFGKIEILVNNAGITRDSTMSRLTREMWDAVIDTNLGSCFNLCKLTFDDMRAAKFGRVVNIGSINGQAGQYGQVNYAAAKSGIHGFTKALAQEGARFGITVNAIAPGYVDTDMVRAVPKDVLEKIVARDSDGPAGPGARHCPRRAFPDRRRCRFRHRLDDVDQRRPAYVLTAGSGDRGGGSAMRPATVAGCGAIALWSTLGLLSRAAAAIPPLQLTAMAFTVSATLGLALLALRGDLRVLRQPAAVWAHGIFGLFGFHALYFAALAWAPPAEANLINYLWPLLIVLFSAALPGMGLSRWHLAGVGCGLAGCALLLGGGARLSGAAVPGYLMALGSAVTWAVYSVLARRLARVPTGAVAGFCAATAALAAASHFAFEPTVAPDGGVLLGVLVLGVGPVGAAFFLWDIGMKRGDPRLLGTLAYATPVASTLLLWAGGYAALTPALAGAAALVAVGGLLAARG